MHFILLVQALSGNTVTGAMTYSFIQAVQNEPGLTYGRLLNAMHRAIHDAKPGSRFNGPIASFIRKVFIPTQVYFSNLIFLNDIYQMATVIIINYT